MAIKCGRCVSRDRNPHTLLKTVARICAIRPFFALQVLPLAEKQAIELGAEFLSEAFIFSVAVGVLVFVRAFDYVSFVPPTVAESRAKQRIVRVFERDSPQEYNRQAMSKEKEAAFIAENRRMKETVRDT